MDKNTIGASKASEELMKIISGDKKLSGKVLSTMNDFNRGIKEIKKIEDRLIRIRLYDLWTDTYLVNSSYFESEVSHLMQNSIKSIYRQYLPLIKRDKNV